MDKIKKYLLMGLILSLLGLTARASDSEPDFDYPQQVSAQALKDLKRARGNGDGQLAIDALVRYTIAKSSITDECFDTVVTQIDDVRKREKRPDYQALLDYFEAVIFKSYASGHQFSTRENALDEPNPTDYTEWSAEQFQRRTDDLIRRAIANPTALKAYPITDYKRIITGDDKLGFTYCPNLLTFIATQARSLTDDSDLIRQLWQMQQLGSEGNIPATIYTLVERSEADPNSDFDDLEAIYKMYKNNEHSGLALYNLSAYKNYYNSFREYITLHPDGIYAPVIRRKISDIEEMKATVNYDAIIHTGDSVKVSGWVYNVNEFDVKLYRVPDALFYNVKDAPSRYNVADLQLIDTRRVRVEGTVPFSDSYNTSFPAPPYGRYIVLTSFINDEGQQKQLVAVSAGDNFHVGDLTSFSVAAEGQDGNIIVVDTRDGAPVAGATITFSRKDIDNGVTDKQGIFALQKNLLFRPFNYYIAKGDDKYLFSSFSYQPLDISSDGYTDAQVLTDLAIYRPGETVQTVAVLYHNSLEGRNIVPGQRLRIALYDANWKEIESDTLTTDDYGRITRGFTIPTDRMNGSFRVCVYSGAKLNDRIAVKNVEVSEYKAPTFIVNMNESLSVFTKNQPVRLTGKVETYTGLPMAGNEVRLNLREYEWSWYWRWSGKRNGTSILDTTVVTDADGRFELILPAEMFAENDAARHFSYHNYAVEAICTNAAGESQETAHGFIIGGRRGISFANKDSDGLPVLNDKPAKLPLEFNSTDPEEKNVTIYYSVRQTTGGPILLSGNFPSDNPVVDFTSLPSGKYRIDANILTESDDNDSKDYMYVTLYRLNDKQPPVDNVPLWTPAGARSVDDKNVAHVNIGVSFPEAHIYYVAYSRDNVIGQGWLDYKKGWHELTFQIPKQDGDYLSLHLISIYGGKKYEQQIYMASKVKKAMNVNLESFRDKLTPGEHEKWTFRLSDVDGKPFAGAMMLEMMDKAIDDIAHNPWSFSVGRITSDRAGLYAPWSLNGRSGTSISYSRPVDYRNISYDLPSMNFYNESFFGRFSYMDYDLLGAAEGGGVLYEVDYAASNKRANRAMPTAEMQEDAMGLADAAEAPDAGDAVDEEALAGVTLRDGDVKVALWKPLLTSAPDGSVVVEFDAPQYNTTWIMQALAYSSDLYTGAATRNLVTQKPIMVKSSVPRFVRQADKTSLAATLQNATDETQQTDAIIELFDPRTGDILATKTFKHTLAPKATEALAINYDVPDTLAFLGFRVKAANKAFGDGEQVMIPVLQNISPIIETQPFYINAGTPDFAITLPEFPLDARITLEYCDNPVWYCVTALPTIYDDNRDVATSLAHSLYAVAVARGIAADNPQIKDAVDHWVENNDRDSTLVSMLQRNGDLKIGTLLASPWIREADRQSLRMTRLSELLDENYTAAEINRIVSRLEEIQMPDGGWPWFRYPDCKSSVYTTATVLELIGEIQHLGYMKDDARVNTMVKRALNYYDAEELRLFNERQKYAKGDYSGFSDYVYTRSLFPDVPLGKDNQSMMKKCLSAMKKEWKGTSIGSKAFYAVALNRNGEQKTAKSIIESIRQFALVKPELGMYWDNLQSSWGYSKVAITSTVLQAMSEVDPRQEELDQVRKWMLLMKQTNDWGSSSLAADAVYSLLMTGTKWLQPAGENATFTLAGEPLAIDRREAYLGYFRREIPAVSGATLQIERNAQSPAWGAVYSQYRAPMTQIEAADIDDISIRKELHTYDANGTLLPGGTTFKVGDKVQVRVIIKTNKDLDYVTVNDERGACFEPKDKVSGYRYADGAYYYLETKDSMTKMFFTSLRKGTHVISYDAYITAEGEYSVGIATAQSQYAPQITAHSAGSTVTVGVAGK